MIRRLRRAKIAKQKVQVFKPAIDNRYARDIVKSHSGEEMKGLAVNTSAEILANLHSDTTVVGVDEGQFFDKELAQLVKELADHGIRVIMSALDCNFRGECFNETMSKLMFVADYVDKLHAICMVCGEEASWTQRLVNGLPAYYDDPLILVGASEAYEPRCREHHEVPRRDDFSAVKAILDSLSRNDGNRLV
jgi:thymidine kinase